METTRRKDGWWVTGVPECEDCGPYDTRAEADSNRRGLERFERWGHKRNYVTSEREPRNRRRKPPER